MASKTFSYDDFTKFISVSRETFSRLETYVELLKKWQTSINLIGTATINEIWIRHIIDSAQLINNMESAEVIADVGSGAGFPGLIMAILGIKDITLIESDGRKVAFLKEAARVTQADVSIINNRVEHADLEEFSLIVTRGFAPLAAMFSIFGSKLKDSHKLLLLKGKNYKTEIQEARKAWSFEYTVIPSVTDKESAILSIQNFKKGGRNDSE